MYIHGEGGGLREDGAVSVPCGAKINRVASREEHRGSLRTRELGSCSTWSQEAPQEEEGERFGLRSAT